MTDYRHKEIANSLNLWLEYVCGNDNAEINTVWFESMTEQARLDYLVETWGKEFGEEFGTVDYCGEELEIIQQPYASDLIGQEDFYTAEAQCNRGRLFKVLWPITNIDCDDESNACDWDNYEVSIIHG